MNLFSKFIAIVFLLYTIIFYVSGCSDSHNTANKALLEKYHYDDEGRLVEKTNPDGNKTNFKYNGIMTKVLY